MTHDFTLMVELEAPSLDDAAVLARLADTGCTDALVGLGRPGLVSLDFLREAPSAELAIENARNDVLHALPGAKLFHTPHA